MRPVKTIREMPYNSSSPTPLPPRELRVLLSEADMADKQALAARADSFASYHQRLAHDVVAAVASEPVETEEEEWVTAVRPGGSGRGSQRGGGTQPQRGDGKKKAGRGGGGKQSGGRRANWSAGLCYKHARYGAAAHSCLAPCSWSEN